ncbi:MAG: TdeIII family type II restriction endonuclease [Candidatus Cloacimonadales bacterium]
MDKITKELIALEVIKTLWAIFDLLPKNHNIEENGPFHEAFLNAFSDKISNHIADVPFFISLASWLHGLNTTLGQSFFENISHILSNGGKKSFTIKTNSQLTTSDKQKKEIADIITDLKNSNREPNLEEENKRIYRSVGESIPANNFTVDVYYADDTEVNCIELKSVRPNAGEMRGEKQKILEAKAALYNRFPQKKINFFLCFPFDPTSASSLGYDKTRFLHYLVDGQKYFAESEVLIASEYWDYLSGRENTMQELLNIINDIAKPDFIENYNFLNDFNNFYSSKDKFIQKLSSWHLYSEIVSIGKLSHENKKIFEMPLFRTGKVNTTRQKKINFLE